MWRLLLLMLLSFLIGLFYSFIIQKFIRSKIIILLPSIAAVIWFIYTYINFLPRQPVGFEDLALVIIALILIPLIVGNLLGWIYFTKKNKNKFDYF